MSEPQKDIFELFRESEHNLDEAPSAQAWQQLEHRLTLRKPKPKRRVWSSNTQWLLVVIILILLLVAAAMVVWMARQNS